VSQLNGKRLALVNNSSDLVWECPPDMRPRHGRQSIWPDRIEALKKHPGKWAKSPTQYAHIRSSTTMATQLKAQFPGLETTCRGKSLYLRWVGK